MGVLGARRAPKNTGQPADGLCRGYQGAEPIGWFEPGPEGIAPILEAVGDARFVLIGEASHGTDEFYRIRADDACLIGFTAHMGTVTAARDWGEPAERRQVRPSIAGSYERLFHETGIKRFLLRLAEEPARAALMAPRLERAIGLVYKPETERASHYFPARLPEQFDVVIHINTTTALTPLERWAREGADLPETYPTGV